MSITMLAQATTSGSQGGLGLACTLLFSNRKGGKRVGLACGATYWTPTRFRPAFEMGQTINTCNSGGSGRVDPLLYRSTQPDPHSLSTFNLRTSKYRKGIENAQPKSSNIVELMSKIS